MEVLDRITNKLDKIPEMAGGHWIRLIGSEGELVTFVYEQIVGTRVKVNRRMAISSLTFKLVRCAPLSKQGAALGLDVIL